MEDKELKYKVPSEGIIIELDLAKIPKGMDIQEFINFWKILNKQVGVNIIESKKDRI